MPLFMRRLCWMLPLLLLLLGGSGCANLKARWESLRRPAAAEAPVPGGSVTGTTAAVAAPGVAAVAPEYSVASRAPYRLRHGDPVIIFLRGILPKEEQIEDIIDERGFVTLPYIDDVMADNLTVSELEREIQRIYIDRQIYRTVTVNVVMPSQSYFVQGEVRQPQRYPLVTGVTMMQAIATAGGYTEFADRKKVNLTRAGTVRVINMRDIERDPQNDISIESGDVIRVPRSIF